MNIPIIDTSFKASGKASPPDLGRFFNDRMHQLNTDRPYTMGSLTIKDELENVIHEVKALQYKGNFHAHNIFQPDCTRSIIIQSLYSPIFSAIYFLSTEGTTKRHKFVVDLLLNDISNSLGKSHGEYIAKQGVKETDYLDDLELAVVHEQTTSYKW